MTKRCLLALLLIILYAHVRAQVGSPRRDFAVGVNGGYALNSISFRPSIKQDIYGGVAFGATARYTCEKYFAMICAVQVEANFTQLGWKEDIETSTDTYMRTLNYMQIPLLANLGFGREHGGLKGFLVLGPQIGFCMSESETMTGEWSDKTLQLRPNHVTQQYGRKVENTFDYGITAGAGIEFSTRRNLHFLLEGRYYFALGDIFSNSKKDPFARSAHGTILIKGSVLFDLLRTK